MKFLGGIRIEIGHICWEESGEITSSTKTCLALEISGQISWQISEKNSETSLQTSGKSNWGLLNGGLRPLSAICARSFVHFCSLSGPLSKRNFRHKMTTIVGNRGQLWPITLSPQLLSPHLDFLGLPPKGVRKRGCYSLILRLFAFVRVCLHLLAFACVYLRFRAVFGKFEICVCLHLRAFESVRLHLQTPPLPPFAAP